jgi:hypothetical protein
MLQIHIANPSFHSRTVTRTVSSRPCRGERESASSSLAEERKHIFPQLLYSSRFCFAVQKDPILIKKHDLWILSYTLPKKFFASEGGAWLPAPAGGDLGSIPLHLHTTPQPGDCLGLECKLGVELRDERGNSSNIQNLCSTTSILSLRWLASATLFAKAAFSRSSPQYKGDDVIPRKLESDQGVWARSAHTNIPG